MEKFLNSRILIVDDEYANIFFLKRVLSGEGYQILTASGGHEALEILDKESPDVILLDIMMPEITGLEVLKRIKENQLTKDIPVIMVSAKTDSTDVEEALDLGAIEYIKKPVNEVELLARLRTSLRIKLYETQLKENIKAKEDFIRIVAHDLRTPFSSISGFAELLKNDEELNKLLNSEHVEFLEYIINSSAFLVEYFNKLLNWAQIGNQDLKLTITKCNISKLINLIHIIFKSKLEEKKINLKIDIPENSFMSLDEVYFSQVINNLIANSIKYTTEGGDIKISFVEGSIVSISDTGVGMSDELIDSIMNNKVIKSSQGTNGEKGTGLGLKICQKILKSHNFNLSIRSVPNQGTTFEINTFSELT